MRYGIPASRILFLARTRRWAIVGSGTRKARAISAVLRPPSSRNVSATWAAVASDGWQQVKMRRSRSSRTGPSSAGSRPASAACSTAACACRSSRDDSRLSRSIARFRAVVMIHPAGLGGAPAAGHRSSAVVNASWTASSATSISPKMRTRTATARPYSSRNTRSMSRSGCCWGPGVGGSVRCIALERPHFHRQACRLGVPPAPGQSHVEVRRLDDHEPTQVLLALNERAVRDEHFVVRCAQHSRGFRGAEAVAEHPRALVDEFLPNDSELLHDRPEDFGGRGVALGLVHAEQVLLHGRCSFFRSGLPFGQLIAGLSLPTRTGNARIDSRAPKFWRFGNGSGIRALGP